MSQAWFLAAATQSILANQGVDHVTKPKLVDPQGSTVFPNGLPITESDKKRIAQWLQKITI